MRTISPSLQAKLDGGATTLCWCWRIERRDGAVLGFTDHDRDLAFGGVAYAARGGFQPGEARCELGFTVDAASIAGALDGEALTEADLASGTYDGARIVCLRVDWAEPEDRVTAWTAEIGQTRRGETAFEAELRGLTHRLTQTTGRVYSRRCDAELGDGRCGRDVSGPDFTSAGTVAAALSARAVRVRGLGDYERGWFTRGRLRWTSGANAGTIQDVELHRGKILELTAAPPGPIQADDGFEVTAGCDKRLSTCRQKFANVTNFRGFPFMPGNDALLAGPAAEATPDGGSRHLDD